MLKKVKNPGSVILDSFNTNLLFDALNASQSPLLIHDLTGNILYFNEAQQLLHGYSCEELSGKNISLFYNDSSLSQINEIISGVIKLGCWEGELIERDKEGRKITVSKKLKVLKDKNKPVAIAVYSLDLSVKRHLEEENAKFKFSIQHSHEIILMTDSNGTIEYVNPQFENFYGYSNDEVIGKTPSILKSGIMTSEFYANFLKDLYSGRRINEEFVNITKFNQLVTVEESISPYFDENNKIAGFISIQRDITEKKHDEDLLRRALDKAEESDNLKTAFLNQMSHEIRTPLNSILGFMSLMQEELVNEGNTHLIQYFASINRSATRLQRTIEDILAMSSIQTGNFYTSMNKINLEEVINLLLDDFSSFATEKEIELIFANKSESSYLLADSYTIINSFQHLIDNAIKFTNRGKVEITIYDQDGSLCVDIRDTGIGISKQYIDNLFKPFSQEEVGYNRRYDGNGLGLALTKEYLRLNHATISVQSEKGKGTIFTITFFLQDTQQEFPQELKQMY